MGAEGMVRVEAVGGCVRSGGEVYDISLDFILQVLVAY